MSFCFVCSTRCFAGETPRNGHTGRLVGSRFSPDTALDGDPPWWCWVPGSGQNGRGVWLTDTRPRLKYLGVVFREAGGSSIVSGCPGSHDNDKREVSSGGGLWLGCRRVSGVTIHRKGCHGGELRLVSRQFLWCVVSSGRLALLDLSLLPWSLLAMTKQA